MSAAQSAPNHDAVVAAVNRRLRNEGLRLRVARLRSVEIDQYGRYRIERIRDGRVVSRHVDLLKVATAHGVIVGELSPRPLVAETRITAAEQEVGRLRAALRGAEAYLRNLWALARRAKKERGGQA